MKSLKDIKRIRNGRVFQFQVTKQVNEYWASCLQLPGVVTNGDTLKQLEKNIDAILDERLQLPF